MAEYKDPDEWISQSQVPWGTDDSRTESIKQSWVSTNRAAYGVLSLVQGIVGSVADLPGKVLEAVVAKRWRYGNQEGIPEEHQGTNNLFEATEASNTRIYHPDLGLAAIADRQKKQGELLAKIAAKVGVTPGN